jgi:spore coat protein SA
MIYDLLPEVEEFCTYRGGAISKVVANVARHDPNRVVVASSANDSWGFPSNRVLTIPVLQAYGRVRGTRFLPAWVKGHFYRHAYHHLLARLQPGDLVWCHNQPYIAQALAVAIVSSGAKLVYHAHDRHIPATAREAFQSMAPSAWVFVSDALRQRFITEFPYLQNTHVVHNGADETLFYPESKDGLASDAVPIVVYVGRLHEEKGTHILVDAMEILRKRGVRVLCRIIGSSFSGGSEPTPYVLALQKASPSNVEFLGYRAPGDVAQELRAADILCCPSICEEGFGSVNIEAMACGLPVVASKIGGIPEIAADGGIVLVKPNSALELADALQVLIENVTLRETIGAEGLAAFQRKFTWAVIAKQHSALAQELLSAKESYA